MIDFQKRVSDYYVASRLPKETFTARYPRPFLIAASNWSHASEGSHDEDPGFFTTVEDGANMADLVEIAKGRMLNPESWVFPLVKRSGTAAKSMIVTLGRAENCDVVIAAPGISKSHCYISTAIFQDSRYLLIDPGSTNGTQLNGRRLDPGHKAALSSGDRISIGDGVVLRFCLSEDFWKALKRAPRQYR